MVCCCWCLMIIKGMAIYFIGKVSTVVNFIFRSAPPIHLFWPEIPHLLLDTRKHKKHRFYIVFYTDFIILLLYEYYNVNLAWNLYNISWHIHALGEAQYFTKTKQVSQGCKIMQTLCSFFTCKLFFSEPNYLLTGSCIFKKIQTIPFSVSPAILYT